MLSSYPDHVSWDYGTMIITILYHDDLMVHLNANMMTYFMMTCHAAIFWCHAMIIRHDDTPSLYVAIVHSWCVTLKCLHDISCWRIIVIYNDYMSWWCPVMILLFSFATNSAPGALPRPSPPSLGAGGLSWPLSPGPTSSPGHEGSSRSNVLSSFFVRFLTCFHVCL